jgi:hypothetical protein
MKIVMKMRTDEDAPGPDGEGNSGNELVDFLMGRRT